VVRSELIDSQLLLLLMMMMMMMTSPDQFYIECNKMLTKRALFARPVQQIIKR
jgi:hypothetical protein